MKLKELYPDVITEDTEYEYKATINPDKPIKWAKTLVRKIWFDRTAWWILPKILWKVLSKG